MKFSTQKKLFSFCILSLISIIFFFACQKDLSNQLLLKPESHLTVGEVEQGFNNQIVASSFGNSQIFNPINYLNPKPAWFASIRRKIGNQEFIETPLSLEKNLAIIHTLSSANKNRAANEVWRYISLVSTKNSSGAIESKYIFFIPDLDFIKSNKNDLLELNFSKIPKKFSGNVLAYNTDGSFSTGWVYDKGKLKGNITGVVLNSVGTLSTRTLCYETCTTWTQHTNYDATPIPLSTTCFTTCVDTGPSSGSGGISFGSLGSVDLSSGGGSSVTSIDITPVPSQLTGKCINPVQSLCPNSLVVTRKTIVVNGFQGTITEINMRDYAIGVRDNNGVMLPYKIAYSSISTNTPIDFVGYEPLVVQLVFTKIVQDLQDYARNNNITAAEYKPGLPLFPIGLNGRMGTMGDYLQNSFDALYRKYFDQLTGGFNLFIPATFIRSGFGINGSPGGYSPVVADDNC
jgi:hypothetical protein